MCLNEDTQVATSVLSLLKAYVQKLTVITHKSSGVPGETYWHVYIKRGAGGWQMGHLFSKIRKLNFMQSYPGYCFLKIDSV